MTREEFAEKWFPQAGFMFFADLDLLLSAARKAAMEEALLIAIDKGCYEPHQCCCDNIAMAIRAAKETK